MKAGQPDVFIDTLKSRFRQNMRRHAGVDWVDVHGRLQSSPDKLRSLHEMEKTGGEPDIIGTADDSGAYLFCDCAAETPNGRRSLCYDAQALNSRKQNKPQNSAMDMAAGMGVSL